MYVVLKSVQIRCCNVRQPNWLALVGNALLIAFCRKANLLVGEVEANGVIVGCGTIYIVLEAITDTSDLLTAFVVRARDVLVHFFDSIIVHDFEVNGSNRDKRSVTSLPLGLRSHVS